MGENDERTAVHEALPSPQWPDYITDIAIDVDPGQLPQELVAWGILERAKIINVRRGGTIECYVRAEFIDSEEVPVRGEWSEQLAHQMAKRAESHGDNGQESPISLGIVTEDSDDLRGLKLRIKDGFHRNDGLIKNEQPYVLANLEVNTWDELYDSRIFNAKNHSQIKFSRVVQWIREIWEISPHSRIDVTGGRKLSLRQAIRLFNNKSDGTGLGLTPEQLAGINEWVGQKEKNWELDAMTIHNYLEIAEKVDPELIHAAQDKEGPGTYEAPTQGMLRVFSKEIPEDFERQRFVYTVTTWAQRPVEKGGMRGLNLKEIQALSQIVQSCTTVKQAEQKIKRINWNTWQPDAAAIPKTRLSANSPIHLGRRSLKRTVEEVRLVRRRVQYALDNDEPVDTRGELNVDAALDESIGVAANVVRLAVEISELTGDPLDIEDVAAKIGSLISGHKLQIETKAPPVVQVAEAEPSQQLSADLAELHANVMGFLGGSASIDTITAPRNETGKQNIRTILQFIYRSYEVMPETWENRVEALRRLYQISNGK